MVRRGKGEACKLSHLGPLPWVTGVPWWIKGVHSEMRQCPEPLGPGSAILPETEPEDEVTLKRSPDLM